MSFALCFWILMLLWFVFGLWHNWPSSRPIGGHLLLFVLLLLLGWKLFGPPIHS